MQALSYEPGIRNPLEDSWCQNELSPSSSAAWRSVKRISANWTGGQKILLCFLSIPSVPLSFYLLWRVDCTPLPHPFRVTLVYKLKDGSSKLAHLLGVVISVSSLER